jgi:hypothetical protein
MKSLRSAGRLSSGDKNRPANLGRTRNRVAGIAPASLNPQVVSPHDSCVNTPPPCLHTVCTDLALRELVASWHRLTPDVRETIVRIARGHGDFSRVGSVVDGDRLEARLESQWVWRFSRRWRRSDDRGRNSGADREHCPTAD